MRNVWGLLRDRGGDFPRAAQVVAVVTAATTYLLIALGSHVRVTESGMGCPDWPLCYGQAGPVMDFHALMEQAHRYLASLVSILVILTAVLVLRHRSARSAAVRPALFAVAMLGVQIVLGGVTVFAGNGSPTVALHLVAGLTLFASTTVTAVCTIVIKSPATGPRLPTIAWVAVGAVALLMIAGSLIVDARAEGLCPEIPLCPTGNTTGQTVVHLLHRVIAVVTASIVWTFAWRVWHRWNWVRGARTLAVVASSLLAATAGIGITSALLMAPPVWADLHLAGASGVLASVLTLAVVGWLAGVGNSEPPEPSQTSGTRPALVGAGLVGAALALGVLALGYGIGRHETTPGTAVGAAAAAVPATGHTTTAQVSIEGMRFFPEVVEVPAGDALVIELTNNGDRVHDLVLTGGQRTARLAPGESERMDAGVVTEPLDAWCSIAGHQSMGMSLRIAVTGSPDSTGTPTSGSTTHHQADSAPAPTASGNADAAPDLMASPGRGFRAHPARLPASHGGTVHRIRLPVVARKQEVAPGLTQTRWTFGGASPAPTLRGKVGDRFVITLINRGDIGHSIDFHAGALAPDRPMRTIEPGQRLRYRFTATKSGIWLYHCSTMPMSLHIANGMFGAVIIDPPDLAPVDREFLLVQSEVYPGPAGGTADESALAADQPSLVVFNGVANQYDHRPLRVRVGERIRMWLLAAGPNRGTSFHVVGAQFDTTYLEGSYQLRSGAGGSQALGLTAAQGGFVETTFTQPGHYPFVSHAMVDAERGAHGMVVATRR